MNNKINTREIALQMIHKIKEQQAYANITLAKMLAERNCSQQDRRFITELVYGTIKAGNTLDWILEQYMNRPMKKITPIIQNILRMGIYQIRFMSKVPDSAACNESVNLAKKHGHIGTVKFVNAVLRNCIRQPEKVQYPDKTTNLTDHLALKYYHPHWLVSRWIKRLGADAAEKLCEFNNQTPLLSFRCNTLKISPSALAEKLAANGINATPSVWTPEGFLLDVSPSLNNWDLLQNGYLQIQDESSMLVAHILDPQPGEYIIDTCSAPGGKTTHIAALMKNHGKILAFDIYDHKLDKIKENANRLAIDIIETKLMDALYIGEHFAGKADRVLVDAPCSGLGVLRKKPDSRWRKEETLIQELAILQSAILSSGAQAVKPGGTLVYSTCTTEPEENQAVVEKFLSCHADFVLDTATDYLPQKKKTGNLLQFWPQEDGIDGFFIARMKRKG